MDVAPAARMRAAVALCVALAAAVAAPRGARAAGPCDSIGWQEITASGKQIRNVSSLAGPAGDGRMFAGSRRGTDNTTLFSGFPSAAQWQAETAFTGIPVTDLLVTAGRPTEVWVSTFGAPPGFDGPVLGRGAGELFTPRGTLQSWFMSLAATQDDVFVAASKPEDRGVHRWDEAGGDWQRVGGASIDTVTYHAFASGEDDRLWLGTDMRGLWSSVDLGVTWQPVGEAGVSVWSVAVAPGRPDVILMGLGPPDGGASVAGYPRGLRISPDGGRAWVEAAQPDLRSADIVTSLAFGGAGGQHVYAAGYDKGLFASRDSGVTWSPFPVPAAHQRFFETLLVLPVSATCELLFAGGAEGLWARNTMPSPATLYLPVAAKGIRLGPG